MKAIRVLGTGLIFSLISAATTIILPVLLFLLLFYFFPELGYHTFGIILLLFLVGIGIVFLIWSLKNDRWLSRLSDHLKEWTDKERKNSESGISDAYFEEIDHGSGRKNPKKKGKIGYVLMVILGVGLFLWVSFTLRSCGSSKEAESIPMIDPQEEISDSISIDEKVPTAFSPLPFDLTKPVTKDSFALVWGREVEVLIPPNHWGRFDFDQAETLRVRLLDGQVFEKTHDQWFLKGGPVTGLPAEIPGLSVFLSSKRNIDVTFSKRPK